MEAKHGTPVEAVVLDADRRRRRDEVSYEVVQSSPRPRQVPLQADQAAAIVDAEEIVPPSPLAKAATVFTAERFSLVVAGSFSLYSSYAPSAWVTNLLRSATGSSGNSVSMSGLRCPPQPPSERKSSHGV